MMKKTWKCILVIAGTICMLVWNGHIVRASDPAETVGSEERDLMDKGYPKQWVNSLGDKDAVNEIYKSVLERSAEEGINVKGVVGASIALGDGELRWDYIVYSKGASVVYVDVAVYYRWMTEQADCWDDLVRLEYNGDKFVFDSDRFMTWNFVKDKRNGKVKGYNYSDTLGMFSIGSAGWFPDGKNPSFAQTLQYEPGGGALITLLPKEEVLKTDEFIVGAEYVRGSLKHTEVFQGILAGLLVVFGIYWCGRKKQG